MNLVKATQKAMQAMQIPASAKLLVGASGGVDSMTLLHVLQQCGFPVTAAHVNFHLRGEESDADAQHVRQWCAAQAIPVIELDVDTKAFAAQYNLSTQVAARNLRYQWWNKLIGQDEFDYVATAHHQDDHIETVFINLLHGTGLKGLTGIPMKRQHFIRPFLDVTRADIEAYAAANQIPFRTDSSNESDDYLRNRIRHHLIPLAQEMVPGFQNRMKQTSMRTALEWKAWEKAYADWRAHHIIQAVDAHQIIQAAGNEAFVLRYLENRGIPWKLAHDYVMAQPTHRSNALQYENIKVTRTTDGFHVAWIQGPVESLVLEAPGEYHTKQYSFFVEPVDKTSFEKNNQPGVEYISSTVVSFPMTLRPVQPGDVFQPLGMGGKSKKLQDLLVDRKLDMHEKEKVLVLANASHPVWIVSIQLDERAKVNEGEEGIFRLRYVPH